MSTVLSRRAGLTMGATGLFAAALPAAAQAPAGPAPAPAVPTTGQGGPALVRGSSRERLAGFKDIMAREIERGSFNG